MSHKHCVFCGEEVPCPRPTSFSLVCDSPLNNTAPDTFGKKYHAVIIGRAKNEPTPLAFVAAQPDNRMRCAECKEPVCDHVYARLARKVPTSVELVEMAKSALDSYQKSLQFRLADAQLRGEIVAFAAAFAQKVLEEKR